MEGILPRSDGAWRAYADSQMDCWYDDEAEEEGEGSLLQNSAEAIEPAVQLALFEGGEDEARHTPAPARRDVYYRTRAGQYVLAT